MIFQRIKTLSLAVIAGCVCITYPVNISEEYNVSKTVILQDTKSAAQTGVSFLTVQIPKTTYLGYASASVNVRSAPSTDSDILSTYIFNRQIKYSDYDDEWVSIDYNGQTGYIYKSYISDESCNYIDYDIPETSGFKSYMSYKCITSVNSPQYKLQNTEAYTGTYGIRQVDGRYCVAIGSYFTSEIGTWFDLVLKNGTVIPCILADQKADKDTDSNNIVTQHNGCMSEFVVDDDALKYSAKRDGDISSCTELWNSPVDYVRVYRKEN